MVKFAKAIAGNSDLLTAQAFVFITQNISLAALITASGEDVFTKVRMSANLLEEKFFEAEETIPARLEKAATLLLEQLKDISDLEILLAAWQENTLYLISQGSHQAYIIRDNQLTNITPKNHQDGVAQNQLISGHLLPGDRLFLVTSYGETLLENKDDRKIKIGSTDIESFEEEINILWREPTQETSENSELSSDATLVEVKDPIAAILVAYPVEEKVASFDAFPPKITRVDRPNLFSMLLVSLKKLSGFILGNKKVMLGLVAVLVVLIVIGGFITMRNRGQSQKNGQIDAYLAVGADKLNQAETLKDSDSKASIQNLNEARQNVAKAVAISANNPKAKDLQNKIDEASPQILKIYKVDNFPVFLSLDLIKKDFGSNRISYSLGKVLLLDTSKKTLVSVDIQNKSNQLLGGADQLGQAQFASINGDFAFAYSPDKAVTRVDLQAKKATTAVKTDPEWGKISDIFGFGTNIYLLDALKNQIWKYVPVVSGYSNKTEYFKDKSGVDLADVKRMLIDSSVWFLKQDGGIEKYTSGVKDNFSIGGLDKNISSVSNFFVSDEVEHVYVLDSGNSRLIVFDKSGQYVSQYIGEKFKTASDLIVDEKNKKIYLLEGNKIYVLDLH